MGDDESGSGRGYEGRKEDKVLFNRLDGICVVKTVGWWVNGVGGPPFGKPLPISNLDS